MQLAPIALFVYNRPEHTRLVIESVLSNPGAAATDIYIFSDAPKVVSHASAVAKVRAYIRDISGFASVAIIERKQNLGLAKSIIDGVSEICERYGRCIVLEDDIVVGEGFLDYMNSALVIYEDDQRVAAVGGYMFPVDEKMPSYFFLRVTDCWGWATWKRAWRMFEPDGSRLLSEIRRRRLTHEFDLRGAYPYTRMLELQVGGRNQSWAIRWYASAFLQNALTLYSERSQTRNIGHDGSGENCEATSAFEHERLMAPAERLVWIEPREDLNALNIVAAFLRRRRTGIGVRVFRRVARILERIRRALCNG